MASKKKADRPDPDISEVDFSAFVHGPTKNPSAQLAILEALASDPSTAPTHGSLDDRKRRPIDAAALANAAGTQVGSPFLWRQKPPKYFGMVDATPFPVGRVSLDYEDVGKDRVASVCQALIRLVDRLQPAYAILHFKWADPSDEQVASMAGFDAKEIHYCKYGPPGVYAWTWFGPRLLAEFGMAALLAQGATPTAWGGASLPLVEVPWEAPFDELRTRQVAVDKALRSKGIFGDYSGAVLKKGAKWTPPPGMPVRPSRGSESP